MKQTREVIQSKAENEITKIQLSFQHKHYAHSAHSHCLRFRMFFVRHFVDHSIIYYIINALTNQKRVKEFRFNNFDEILNEHSVVMIPVEDIIFTTDG